MTHMAIESPITLRALDEIKDMAIMLSLGNEYLCEELFLRKFGLQIDSNALKLRGDILALKKKVPGKFKQEIDTDGLLKEIQRTAQRLQNPDKALSGQCTAGILGKELGSHINSLTNGIIEIRGRIEGKAQVYSRKDSVFKGLTNMGSSMGRTFVSLVKVFICVILIAGLFFAGLFLTMPKDDPLLKNIARSEAVIQSKQIILDRLDEEKKGISKEIVVLQRKSKTRQEKIALLELEGRIHEINEEDHNVKTEIAIHERKINENQEKLDEMRKKSLIQRLLRL